MYNYGNIHTIIIRVVWSEDDVILLDEIILIPNVYTHPDK